MASRNRPAGDSGLTFAELRRWARDAGYYVAERGRIPHYIYEAFRTRRTLPPPPAEDIVAVLAELVVWTGNDRPPPPGGGAR